MKGSFEAKKHAIRQTQDGWVVSFVVHPNDMTPEFAASPLGTHLMLAYAKIGDDGQPVTASGGSEAHPPAPSDASPPAEPSDTRNLDRSAAAKDAYREKPLWAKAQTRAGMLPGDQRFRRWVASQVECEPRVLMVDGSWATEFIRDRVGGSRGLISTEKESYDAFVKMETEYLIATGQLAEAR